MKTRPRRFKLFVTAGTLRYGRFGSGGGGNFGVPPAIRGWDTPPLPAMRLRAVETWNYATGQWSTTAAANWFGFSGAANLVNTGGVLPGILQGNTTSAVGFGEGFSGTWKSQVDISLSFALDFRVWMLNVGTGGGNPGNQINWGIGSGAHSWGVLFQNDATNGLFFNVSWPTAAGTATGANTAMTGTLNGDQFRLLVNVSTPLLTLSRNGTVIGSSGAGLVVPPSFAVGPVLGLNTMNGANSLVIELGKLSLWQ